jgi:hypothetical protein
MQLGYIVRIQDATCKLSLNCDIRISLLERGIDRSEWSCQGTGCKYGQSRRTDVLCRRRSCCGCGRFSPPSNLILSLGYLGLIKGL